jgi:hypothetical protein
VLRHGDEPVRVRRVSVVRLALALRHGDCPFESWSDELFACSDEQRIKLSDENVMRHLTKKAAIEYLSWLMVLLGVAECAFV